MAPFSLRPTHPIKHTTLYQKKTSLHNKICVTRYLIILRRGDCKPFGCQRLPRPPPIKRSEKLLRRRRALHIYSWSRKDRVSLKCQPSACRITYMFRRDSLSSLHFLHPAVSLSHCCFSFNLLHLAYIISDSLSLFVLCSLPTSLNTSILL